MSITTESVAFSSVNQEEVEKFNGVQWWDQEGTMKPLVSFNKIRVPFIRDGLLESTHIPGQENTRKDGRLDGFRILDVGCGGGILSEGLGQVGATVVGIDPGLKNVSIASKHLPTELQASVSYECTTIEEFASQNPNCSFDAVVMSEVIEHVENPKEVISTAIELLKPNGSLFITTPNRSFMSWLGVIVAAEYVLRILPVGTHEWKKFLTPKDVQKILDANGVNTKKLRGITYNPITNVWDWTYFTQVQYALHGIKSSK